ncbi:MAG TPA: hypothetical protein PLP83_12200 [Candidatus Aminicenantes bacterium]|nr:hypothetical protein [Candidatus Aminicenantes bacterium]
MRSCERPSVSWRTRRRTSSPAAVRLRMSSKSRTEATLLRLTSMMIRPARRLARSASLPRRTSVMSRPSVVFSP